MKRSDFRDVVGSSDDVCDRVRATDAVCDEEEFYALREASAVWLGSW